MVQRIGNRLLIAAQTDVGRVRTLNEDVFLVDEQIGLLMVADGMGGHDAGEIASRKVVESIRTALRMSTGLDPATHTPHPLPDVAPPVSQDDERTVDEAPNPIFNMVNTAIHRANAAVNAHNIERGYPDGMGMGSTLVGLWMPEFSQRPLIFHVGDSRIYLYRQGSMRQLTQDHSMYQQWLNYGSHGQAPAQNILLQAMGPANVVAPDIAFQDFVSGDLLLLCSDGLSSMVSAHRIVEVLRAAGEENLEASCQQLIELAYRAGGRDNITVILGLVL
ncbi:MAG: serine/threonine-protein phosphatase [Magnetococcales bacterium]|nr:serine/threonine-protein phosphatase [Magnetococcales bacterium]